MKVITRIFIALVTLAVVAFFAIVIFFPEKGLELQTKLEDIVNRRSEVIEVTPVKELSIAYPFPIPMEDLEHGYDATQIYDPVYTWFRDLNRDLWLRFSLDTHDPATAGGVLIVNPDGIVKELTPEDYFGDTRQGQVCIRASALADLPQGDYWFAVLKVPEEEIPNYSGPYHLLYYVAVYDECTFHTEDYFVTNSEGFDIVYDRSSGEGYSFHLANLGDNVVTDVWKQEVGISVSRTNLKKGKDYIVSEDGATVTITPEYLHSLQNFYGYPFLFGLGDHSEVGGWDDQKMEGQRLYLTDGPLQDPPSVDGERFYSLSSGEDYVLKIHPGRAADTGYQIMGFFYGDEGPIDPDKDGDARNSLSFLPEDVQPDGTYRVSGDLIREMAARGANNVYLMGVFDFTQFGAASFSPTDGFPVNFIP